MTRLPVPVRQVLLPAADDLMVERVARRLAQRDRAARRRPSPRLIAALVALLGFAALAWVKLAQPKVAVATPPPVLPRLPAPPSSAPPAEQTVAPAPAPAPAPVPVPVELAAPRRAPPVPAAQPDWRPLAESADFDRAYALLGAEGFTREAERSLSVHDLFLLADVARFSGRPALAVAPLERLLSRFGDHPDASLAAFTLGKLQLDVLGEPAKAALAFERAISLEARGTLREEAYARLVEARSRAGDASGAEAAATEYRRLFPNGRPLPK